MRKFYPVAAPVAALLVAMICFQLGAAIAKGMFPIVGVAGTTALRLGLGALILVIVWRPWRLRLNAREARLIAIYGATLGWMNYFFYLALGSIPLGIAVALEFTGPLGVALFASRRPLDFLWILIAALGLVALLPLGVGAVPLPARGVLFALAAGVCWAIYIIVGRKAGVAAGGPVTALGMLIGAAFIVPIGVMQNGAHLVSAAVLPAALGVALLSSALPYPLEMYALPRLPARTFGILMSLDPALGALAGMAFLGESLNWVQWSAIGAIVIASGGSAASSGAVQPDAAAV